jgi:fructose-specific phosphotransferase system IIC component
MPKQWQFFKERSFNPFLISGLPILLAILCGQGMFWLGMGKTGLFLGAMVTGWMAGYFMQTLRVVVSIPLLFDWLEQRRY